MTTLILPVIFVSVHLIIIALGYLIKYKKQMWLIAGYSAKRVRDNNGLANWVGSGALLVGVFGIVVGILYLALPKFILELTLVYIVAVLAGCLIMVQGCQRFTNKIVKN
ncbi:MAG: DUF3784 domain-containing protein [candidate division KSB1 bacterium]|nr:DUF3784 domain-containing protein [candidate division KSB1 bacterium]MDZ7273322.1 DUF3784 domain-containing protein [candidate division KSB1 bacterium]MDZ7285426.1 DUF3784 domain-containing protein [candidate division KSB1 bacterium]MDZ7298457.1 DUF3784 domain-containing protein [candidate division KSB1 bacterium]MDZ7348910.1 DUF3784 domain-containing protein [candidate division KSB1 bacterium]